eukprot:3766580-Prymnesium_polylepis.1
MGAAVARVPRRARVQRRSSHDTRRRVAAPASPVRGEGEGGGCRVRVQMRGFGKSPRAWFRFGVRVSGGGVGWPHDAKVRL